MHSLDNGHFKTASFWNISFEDSGTNHAHSKLLQKGRLRDLTAKEKNWANRKTRFDAFDADSERGFN